MNKQFKYTYGGINQDITKSKHPHTHYFEGRHIKLISTNDQTSGSVANEKGTSLVITIPATITITPSANTIGYGTYGTRILNYTNGNEIDAGVNDGSIPTVSTTQKIIGSVNTRTGIVFFSTDNNGMDCIFIVKDIVGNNYSIELLYLRNLGFSTSNPIQAIFNYENDNIQKIYWVDGIHQIRNINIKHDAIEGNKPLIDVALTSIDFVGKVSFTQPVINTVISGGNHTSGMVQYTYNLYRLNSSQTKLAPLSKLVPLGKRTTSGGGDVNEVVGSTPLVTINNVDTSYDYIKVYAVKYTSLNQIPSVGLIEEREITGNTITVYDDGTIIDTLTLEEFVFVGSDPIIPEHIETKDNRLFPVNITSQPFILPDELDTRAYSWKNDNTCIVIDRVTGTSGDGDIATGPSTYISHPSYTYSDKKDGVNYSYKTYKYQRNSGVTKGGEGKFVKYEIVQKALTNPENYRVFKDEEIYRIAIEFYNEVGQTSLPKWIGDYLMPKGNLQGVYNTLKVTFKTEFYTWLDTYDFEENQRPIGYRILIAERKESDKTIIAQGILTSTMFQVYGDEAKNWEQFTGNTIARESFQDGELKIPSFLTRTFQRFPVTTGSDVNGVLQPTSHLKWLNDGGNQGEGGEIFTIGVPRNDKTSQTFLHTKLINFYCPEVLFETGAAVNAATRLKTKGAVLNTANGILAEERLSTAKTTIRNGKSYSGLNPFRINTSDYIINNDFKRMFETAEATKSSSPGGNAFIGPIGNPNSAGGESMGFHQYYRAYNNFDPSSNTPSNVIYGSPEIAERGGSSTFYNNDPAFKYANNLISFASDGNEAERYSALPITTINSFNARCVYIVLGTESQDTSDRLGIEQLYNTGGLSDPNGMLLMELTREPNYKYIGNIYGGNSYEDKKRTKYIGIGSYTPITTTSIQIDDPGDTYVQKFTFLRIGKSDTEVYDASALQVSEVVEYYTETTVDLKNRNDISFGSWDDRFQPQYSEFHKYNKVYSQQSNLITNEDTNLTFRRIDNFDTRITTTKLKIPNETIDSWTDLLVNETMDLNGKFGPINSIIEYNDELFVFQDEGIAKITINPRVQIQANDGVGIELGTGDILYDYKYLTTKSGSINKWGIVSTKRGIYYYDALNKGIGRIPDHTSMLLTDAKGLHSYFNTNYDYSYIEQDNPVLLAGATFGYDNYNNDVYFTLHQGDKSFTRCYNELSDEFIDLKSYLPTRYIYKGEKLLSVAVDSKKIYEHYKGMYNHYHGSYSSSYIILQLNPEADYDCVFNTIHYNSELYLNTIDQPEKTLTHIQAYNEYQDSGRIPLIVGRDKNLRRKFREWQAAIPRVSQSRGRVRNPWIYLKLELDNVSNYKFILHDIIINYTV